MSRAPRQAPDPDRRRFLKVASLGAAVLAAEACGASPGEPGDGGAGADGGVGADSGPGRDAGPGPDGGGPVGDLPAVTSNGDFFVTQKGATPTVDGATWTLEIDGAVSQAATLRLADLDALGAVDKEHTLACIGSSPGSPAIGNALWSGRPLAEVLAHLGVARRAEAIELHLEGADGYRTAIPVSDLSDRELWLVWRMNGVPLPPEHGYPLRLLVPGRYGMKNPKWLQRITFGTEPLLGFWESVGWSNDASYRPLSYFLQPGRNARVPEGTVTLQGAAFCGGTAITRVEISADGGATWLPAGVTYQGPVDAWTLWRVDWAAPGPGTYDLLSRVECADGRATDPAWQNDLGGYAGYGTLTITVG